MCGICGYIRYGTPVGPEGQSIIERMNNRLSHRGPDAQSIELLDNVALGFCRLSIIGLANGMQPIYNEDRSLVLVCNGEIFNYIELREELRKRGHYFTTESDVEVILHLYEEHDTGFLNLLNGQFAFALYDKRKRSLFCARDQMGILPFFYSRTKNSFVFGSEIKAILQHPDIDTALDMVGLDQILTFAGLVSPRTMFQNINSLENGHYLLVDAAGEVTKTEYWDLIYPENEEEMDRPEQYYIDELEALFEASIRLRLRADVPIGFYLSGGLDSSMIAMKVDRLVPGVRKEAFSIDFVESRISESMYQKLIARESNAHLNNKLFFYDDISRRLEHAVYHSECPLKETYNTASLSLSESVRSKGIKVILSGEGADELFAGYVGYRFDKMRAMNPMGSHIGPGESALREKVWGDPSFFYETDFTALEEAKRNLYSADVCAAFGEVDCLNHRVVNTQRLQGRNLLSKRSYIDYKLRLVDHLVSDHGDRMALANSVEVRYPFLDKDFVEFSTRVPASLKLHEFTEKYILRRMAARFVPKEVAEREKFGFVAPGSPYLLQRNVEYIDDLLSYDRIKRQGYFNADGIEKLKHLYRQQGFALNVPFEADPLITVITLGILLDKFFCTSPIKTIL